MFTKNKDILIICQRGSIQRRREYTEEVYKGKGSIQNEYTEEIYLGKGGVYRVSI